MQNNEFKDYTKAGKIALQVVEYSKEIIKPGMLLLEISQKIHKKIEELGANPAFPVNLSINEIAAHYHPFPEDETRAHGLLKVDIGIHVNGFIADTAFSIDLTPDKKYQKLIEASKQALDSALKLLEENKKTSLNDIGNTIQKTIESYGFSPIINLSGHSLDKYKIHAGITIPNYANGNKNLLDSGVYAIEPFATTGQGEVYEGIPSCIYSVISFKNCRSQLGRKILEYVLDKYKNLPFSLREIQDKFGIMARIAMKQLEQEGIIHNYPQLIEKSHSPVSQAEHTFILKDNEMKITTKM